MLRSTLWRQLRVALMTGLLLGSAAAALAYFRPPLTEQAESAAYDLLVAASHKYLPAPAEEPVIEVRIDDASIDAVRRNSTENLGWPWPRSLIGHGVEELKTLGAKVVVIDSLFYDASPRSTDDEIQFAQSLNKAGNVVLVAEVADYVPPSSNTYGPWSALIGTYPTREAALAIAAKLAASGHDMRLMKRADGVQLWFGAYATRESALQNLAGLEVLGDLNTGEPKLEQLTTSSALETVESQSWVDMRDAIELPGAEWLRLANDSALMFPRPELAAAARVGFANATEDVLDDSRVRDDDYDAPGSSVQRALPLIFRSGDRRYPALALAAVKAAHAGEPNFKLWVEPGRLHVGDRSVPVNRRGEMYVTYPSGPDAFYGVKPKGPPEPIPFANVLASADRREKGRPNDSGLERAIRGKVVVIANTAASIGDMKRTPNPELTSGSDVLASAVRSLMLGDAIAREAHDIDARWAFVLGILGAIYALIVSRLARSSGFVVMSALGMGAGVALWGAFALHQFVEARMWIAVVNPGAAFCLAALVTSWINFGETDADRARVADALGRFTSPAIVETVLGDPRLLAPKRRELTILFSDIAGFTTISEAMPAPRLADLLATYFSEMTVPIASTQGHVDKFIGDAVMAFWNAPLDIRDHAALACEAALAMRDRLVKLQPHLQKEFGVKVSARIGLNSGEVVVGELGAQGKGSENKSTYTCLGDAVNLASRLEGVNKIYGTTILVGARTEELARGRFAFREIDRVRVKGKTEAVAIFELAGLSGKLPDALQHGHARYAMGLAAYRAREFRVAREHFDAALRELPDDGPTRIFLERCTAFVDAPPPSDWDGAHTLHDK